MYREDDAARDARSHALISEIAELERQRVGRAELDHRLESARRELATLQRSPPDAVAEPPPGLVAHLLVFAAAAGASFAGYSLLWA